MATKKNLSRMFTLIYSKQASWLYTWDVVHDKPT